MSINRQITSQSTNLIREKEFPAAERMLLAALQDEPDNVFFLSNLAKCYRGWNKLGQAAEVLDRHEKASEKLEDQELKKKNVCINLGERCQISLRLKQYNAALESANKYLELAPDDVIAHSHQAGAYIGLGEFEKALKASTEALKINPRDVISHGQQGNAYYEMARYTEVLEVSDAITKLAPKNSVAYELRSKAHLGMKEYDKALEAADTHAALRPRDWLSYALQANAHMGLGHYENVVEASRAIIDVGGNDKIGYAHMTKGYIGLKQYDKALVAANNMINLDPNDESGYGLRCIVNIKLSRYSAVDADLGKLKKANSAFYHEYNAVSELATGNFAGAIKSFYDLLNEKFSKSALRSLHDLADNGFGDPFKFNKIVQMAASENFITKQEEQGMLIKDPKIKAEKIPDRDDIAKFIDTSVVEIMKRTYYAYASSTIHTKGSLTPIKKAASMVTGIKTKSDEEQGSDKSWWDDKKPGPEGRGGK